MNEILEYLLLVCPSLPTLQRVSMKLHIAKCPEEPYNKNGGDMN